MRTSGDPLTPSDLETIRWIILDRLMYGEDAEWETIAGGLWPRPSRARVYHRNPAITAAVAELETRLNKIVEAIR